MKTIFILLTCLSISIHSFAQTDSEFFNEVQLLLKKAEGKMIVGLMGDNIKIGSQTFTQDFVSISQIGTGKYGSEWLYDYSKLDWNNIQYYLWAENSNDKLNRLVIEFKNNIVIHQHVKGETSDKRTVDSLELYFLAKDFDKMKSIFSSYYK